MPWIDQMSAFECDKAVTDLGLQLGPDLWTNLEIAAAGQKLPDAHMIQDLSWVVTQLDLEPVINFYHLSSVKHFANCLYIVTTSGH
jgi:hypothetical protein